MSTKILVVDDEPDLELLITQRFRRQIRDGRFDFLFAHNGVEALARLAEHPNVDLVLSDINMPEMDGLTLLTRLPQTSNQLKAVMVSAYGDLQNIRTAMNRGAFDFVTKPIDFDDLEITIQKTIDELVKIRDGLKARHELLAIRRELDVARHIQESILPRDFGPKGPGGGCAIFAGMHPVTEVGGDFYDFFMIDDERLGVVLGDVAGKGIPAAIYMSLSRTLLRSTALQGLDPGECLRHANRTLCAEGDSGLFVTAVYAIVNTRTGVVDYSTAGHYSPSVVRAAGTVETLPVAGGMVLGVEATSRYDAAQAALEPGDLMVLYSDGVTEAVNDREEFFGDDGLEAALRGTVGADETAAVTAVVAGVRAFANGRQQSDDLTLVALRRVGPPA
ncbi:MAG TPA: SpoIIE family protein phosphatase [Vicinamibacterales bacterium]